MITLPFKKREETTNQEVATILDIGQMRKDKAFRNRVHNRKMHNKMAKESRKKNRKK